MTCFMYSWRVLSRNAEAVCVGLLMDETIGLTFSGYLCALGKKYIICMLTLSCGISSVSYSSVMTPLSLHFERYFMNLSVSCFVGSFCSNL